MEENQAHIPDGWENKSLIQLADYINGYGFKPDDWSKEGIPIIRIEQLKNPNTEYDYCNFTIPEKNTINEGDLIFSWSASLFLKIWDRQEAALNQHLFKVIPFGGVDKLFLKYLLDSSILDLMKNAQGSTMQHITRKELHSFHRFLPKSKTEQTQIATILSKVDEAITKTEQLIAKYTRIKTGLMQDLLTKGIDENGNIRSEETHEFKDSALGRIPKEWACVQIENIKEFITSGSRGWAKYYSVEGSQFIRITNLKRSQIEIDRSDLKFVNLPISVEGIRSKLIEGDLLISITADLGIIGIVPKSFGDAFVNQHIALVRLNQEIVNSKFIGYFLISQTGQAMFNFLNDGGAKAGLNLKTISNLFIFKPQLDEQLLIIEKIEKSNEAIVQFNTELSKLQYLKTGLMQDLLSGKVRVNHLIKETASV